MILQRLEARIEPFVCFDHVCAGSGDAAYLDDLSLTIGPGELVALVGPGASGITLLLRLILGLSQPTEGSVSVFGERPGSARALQRVGAVLDSTDMPANLKVHEIIALVSAHFDDPGPVDELIFRFGMKDKLDRSIGSLSGASQRVLSILLARIGRPEGLVLDAPTGGMEVGWRRQFWEMLREYTREGNSVIVSSDVLHDIEIYANRILVLHKGRIVADGTSDEIRNTHGRPATIKSPFEGSDPRYPDDVRTPQQAALALEQVHASSLEHVVLQLTEELQP